MRYEARKPPQDHSLEETHGQQLPPPPSRGGMTARTGGRREDGWAARGQGEAAEGGTGGRGRGRAGAARGGTGGWGGAGAGVVRGEAGESKKITMEGINTQVKT